MRGVAAGVECRAGGVLTGRGVAFAVVAVFTGGLYGSGGGASGVVVVVGDGAGVVSASAAGPHHAHADVTSPQTRSALSDDLLPTVTGALVALASPQ